MTTIFVGDTGTEIILDCGVDVSSATVRKIIVRKAGAKVEWVASPSGVNAIKYVTQAGDIDRPGTWSFQAYIEMPGWKGLGEVAETIVKSAL